VILPDLPGFGGSPRQAKPSIPDIACEVASLLDRLKIAEPVWMGGLSMGGYVLFEFFRQFPQRIRGLGFFATRAVADTKDARENRLRSVEALEKFGMEPYAKKIVKSQLGKTTLETRPEIMRSALDIMISNAQEGAMDSLKAMAERRDSSDLLNSIRVPALIVAGAEDTIVPAAEMEAMHRRISGSEFHVVPQAGHLVNLEQPEAFHRILRDFLFD
jgi:pimeloyl-ACP methyl ester carboxylesterase